MSTAIDMYINQISLTGGIPFSVTLPKAPQPVNADMTTTEEIHTKLQKRQNFNGDILPEKLSLFYFADERNKTGESQTDKGRVILCSGKIIMSVIK